MCMGFAKDIKAWVCMTEHKERDAMMQAWAETFADQDDLPLLLSQGERARPQPEAMPTSAFSVSA